MPRPHFKIYTHFPYLPLGTHYLVRTGATYHSHAHVTHCTGQGHQRGGGRKREKGLCVCYLQSATLAAKQWRTNPQSIQKNSYKTCGQQKGEGVGCRGLMCSQGCSIRPLYGSLCGLCNNCAALHSINKLFKAQLQQRQQQQLTKYVQLGQRQQQQRQ